MNRRGFLKLLGATALTPMIAKATSVIPAAALAHEQHLAMGANLHTSAHAGDAGDAGDRFRARLDRSADCTCDATDDDHTSWLDAKIDQLLGRAARTRRCVTHGSGFVEGGACDPVNRTKET